MLYIYDLNFNLMAKGPKEIIAETGILIDFYFSKGWIVSNHEIDYVEVS